ncbi:MAG: TraR/DksA family transcriptional regulator [Nocardioidaceae bacterium]
MAAKRTTVAKATTEEAVPAKAPTAKKATTTNKTAAKAAAKKPATKKPATKKPATKKPAAKKPATKKATPEPAARRTVKKASSAGKTKAGRLAVREGEKAWTAKEIAGVRQTLALDAARLRTEISSAEQEVDQLLREGGEGAGNDQADVGSNTFERDHEMSMARNARQQLQLVEQAATRIDAGTYGVCESCERPIGKMRLQAFPRATLCLECKQRQERR